MVIKDNTVDTKIILATSSTVFFGEYNEPTRKFKIALGIEHCINRTPAAKPSKLIKLMKPNWFFDQKPIKLVSY